MESKDTSPPSTFSPQGDRPRHFHLLWDSELDELQPLLESIQNNRDEVLERWFNLYLMHFGDTRTLSRAEFMEIFGSELDSTLKDLRDRDIDRFSADIKRIAVLLAERNVPFSELIVSMHLFEESATNSFPPSAPVRIVRAFDKLSHIRTISLADTYFRSKSAVASARIGALEREASALPKEARRYFRGLVGASVAMHCLYEKIEAAGATRGTILIVGESGSGKELVARAIHQCGKATGQPFVALNCAAIPKDLIESELFGYKRGAFSGANTEYLGLFRAAEGGTLFLDEITEMSPDTQAKLLRAVQERTVRPVGSTKELPVEVRLIASTNRSPEEAMRGGKLREDLYYRLQAGVIRVPPLREHLEDIPLLVEHFIDVFNERHTRPTPVVGIEPDALEVLHHHSWPGNVRELANAIESAFTFGRSHTITLKDLPASLTGDGSAAPAFVAPTPPLGSFADVERVTIARALRLTEGNKVKAAELLKISRKKLYAKIAKYGLK